MSKSAQSRVDFSTFYRKIMTINPEAARAVHNNRKPVKGNEEKQNVSLEGLSHIIHILVLVSGAYMNMIMET